MKRLALPAIMACAAFCAACPAAAQDSATQPTGQAFRVDDSGTAALDPVLDMVWRPHGRAATGSLARAATRVGVQLNLAAWLGRSGRIYMTLPRAAGPAVRASWLTGGTLLPGSMVSSGRAMVYAGTIATPLLGDTIELTLEADAARLAPTQALDFGFEIEIDQ